jgi:hypothetical protein
MFCSPPVDPGSPSRACDVVMPVNMSCVFIHPMPVTATALAAIKTVSA